MKKLFFYLVPFLQVVMRFFYPLLEFVKMTAVFIGLPKGEDPNGDWINLAFGFFPVLLLLLPLYTWFGDVGLILSGYLILYAVYRILFTISYYSYLQHSLSLGRGTH